MASPKHSHHRASAAPPASSNSNSKHMSNSKQHARATKQRPLSLRRAMLHSCVCFLVGLLTGFAPSDWTDAASRAAVHANAAATAQVFRALHAMNNTAAGAGALGHLLTLQHYQSYQQQGKQQQHQQPPLDLVVVVTTTTTSTGLSERERRSAGLTRTAHALRLVSPPVVWLVVESAREAGPTARLLRRTGVVYRHLTYGENFTSEAWEEERHHQRKQALAHIEQHRLRGVVLFAGLADVYDVRLLEHLRHIRTVGAWPVATVWEQEKRVAVEGPVCTTAGTAAWFSSSVSASEEAASTSPSPPVMTDDSVHGFAFASDLLWDPARWDRFPTSEPDQSQDSIKFVQRLVVADYNKTRPIPEYSNCSQIMVWRVDTTLL